MSNTKKTNRIFLLLAFVLPYFNAVFLAYGRSNHLNIDLFPQFQMLTPALGIILALVLFHPKDKPYPKKTFFLYILIACLSYLVCLASLFIMGFPIYPFQSILLPLLSLVLAFSIAKLPTDVKEDYRLDLPYPSRLFKILGLFLLLYFSRSLLSMYFDGSLKDLPSYLTPNKISYLFAILVSLPLSFVFFFGEEYGWRAYLQPRLQKKYGMVRGTLLVGLIWGIWHLPLNLFYYASPGTGLLSLVNQIFICLSYSIFFSFAYNYTRSIWTPVLLHYFNNNLILLFTKDLDPSVISGQVFTWKLVASNGLLLVLFFVPFILSKYNRDANYRMPLLGEDNKKGPDTI